MTQSKQHVLDRAIIDIQNQIMFAWKTVMKYEEQMRNISAYEENEEVLLSLIASEKSKIETLTAVLNKLETPVVDTSETERAKDVLRQAGYHVDSLWHIQDVTDRYECDADQAYEVLTQALDKSVESVFEIINEEAMFNQLNVK